MKSLVVNMIGAPGSGKSTLMSMVFAKLKERGIDAETVTEFTKELIWDDAFGKTADETYIYAEQHHRMFRLRDKVDVIVTDRPLLLTVFYNNKYGGGQFGEELNALVMKDFMSYDNINFLLKRVNKYNPHGRVQTESESDELYEDMKLFLKENEIQYTEVEGDVKSADLIINKVIERLNN